MNLVSIAEMITVVGERGEMPSHAFDLGETICILLGSRIGHTGLDHGSGSL